MKVSIIIPVYNEQNSIAPVIKKVHALAIKGIEKEVIVVNDGSTDSTAAQIAKISQSLARPKIKVITHKTNLGKGVAVRTGIQHAKGDFIITQDADFEYDPKYLKELIHVQKNTSADVVYGTRLKRLPYFRSDEKTIRFAIHYVGNKILSFLTSVLYGAWITDMETGYKLISINALNSISLHARGFDFEPEVTIKLLKKGYAIREVPIRTIPRGYSEGKKLNTVRDGLAALMTIIKYRFVD